MFKFNKISAQEKVDFAKNLAVMLKSGLTINEALSSLGEQTRSGVFRKILFRIKESIERGTPLSEAIEKNDVFGGVFLGLVKAGETSGTLDENLSFLADWLERNNDLRKEINAATLYPKIVLGATLLLGGGLAVFILPRLVPLFESLNIELPWITRTLLSFSIFVGRYWTVILIILALLPILFTFLNRIKLVRKFLHRIYLKIPFFGRLNVDYQLALVSQIFSTLFRSGLSLSETLNIVEVAMVNPQYQESVQKIKKRVQTGTSLSEAMSGHPNLYPKNFLNIVLTGERSGTLDGSFTYLADFYSKEVRNKTKRLPTIIEPLLLVVIGLSVGFVALSVILPIYKITSGINR